MGCLDNAFSCIGTGPALFSERVSTEGGELISSSGAVSAEGGGLVSFPDGVSASTPGTAGIASRASASWRFICSSAVSSSGRGFGRALLSSNRSILYLVYQKIMGFDIVL